MLDVQWRIEAYYPTPGYQGGHFSVQDGPDGIPTWDQRPRVCFVPYKGAEPLGTGREDPPIHWSGTVRVAAFGNRFGDIVVEGKNRTVFDGWRPYVVYTLAGPGEG